MTRCLITKLKLISKFINLVQFHKSAKYIIYFIYYIDRQIWDFTYGIKFIPKEHLHLSSVGQSHSGEIVTPILRPLCLFRKHS